MDVKTVVDIVQISDEEFVVFSICEDLKLTYTRNGIREGTKYNRVL
jgi:hypothetical protein